MSKYIFMRVHFNISLKNNYRPNLLLLMQEGTITIKTKVAIKINVSKTSTGSVFPTFVVLIMFFSHMFGS